MGTDADGHSDDSKAGYYSCDIYVIGKYGNDGDNEDNYLPEVNQYRGECICSFLKFAFRLSRAGWDSGLYHPWYASGYTYGSNQRQTEYEGNAAPILAQTYHGGSDVEPEHIED